MAGGEGPLRRRTAKSVEAAAAAAAAGPQVPLRRCSTTKRKASGKEAASGRTPRPRASGSKTKEETAAAEAGKAAAWVKQTHQLPMKDVRWILAQKTKDPPETYEAMKRDNPELVPRPEEEDDEELVGLYVVARAFYDLQEKFPKLENWVRGELNKKGYVEVDDDWFRRTADLQKVIDREWPGIRAMMEELCLSEGGGVGDESESDSDEE